MGKGLGISGLILAIIAVFVPLAGPYITLLALGIVTLGALLGDRTYATATVIIGAANLFFLSPSWLVMMEQSEAPDGSNPVLLTTWIGLALPLGAMTIDQMVWHLSRKDKDKAN